MVSHLCCLMPEAIRPNSCIPLKFPDCPGWWWLLFQCWQQLGKPFFSFLISCTVLWDSELYYLVWGVHVRKKDYCVSGGTNFSRTAWKDNRTVVYDKHPTPSTLPHKILIALYTWLLKNPPKRGWGEGSTSSEGVGKLPLPAGHAAIMGGWAPRLEMHWGATKSGISNSYLWRLCSIKGCKFPGSVLSGERNICPVPNC